MSLDPLLSFSKMKYFLAKVTPGSAETKIDHGTEVTPFPVDPPPEVQSRSINVVLFGETGVGKSSVINLIARKVVAKVSSDVDGCTMQSTRYDIPFDNMNFAIFDTIGLEEPQMGVNGYLKAIERAYELIVKLGAAGGIHLLLFCMRGGRITATTQSNYRLFCECLCSTKVPIALVFTGLEREVEMEDWWMRNKPYIEQYGIRSDGHACITAVQDDIPGDDKYVRSQEKIRELLKSCALKNEAFSPEAHTWFARLGKGMKSFIEKHRNPRRRDVMKVLTRRCKIDPETARKIADMMEKGDTETKDDIPEEQVIAKPDEKDEREASKETVAEDGAMSSQLVDVEAEHVPLSQLGDIKAEPRTDETREKGYRAAIKKDMAKDHVPLSQPSGIKTGLRADEVREREVVKRTLAKDHTPPSRASDTKAEPRIDEAEKKEREVARKNVAKDYVPSNQLDDIKLDPRVRGTKGKDEREVEKRSIANDHTQSNQIGTKTIEARVNWPGREDEREATKRQTTKSDTLPNQRGGVKTEPRSDDGAKDGGQHKRYGIPGDQLLSPAVAEQARQGDAKTKLSSSASLQSRQVRVGSGQS